MAQTRAEHMAWCKARALEYLPADPDQAVASMLSDLGKHEETQGLQPIGLMLVMGDTGDPAKVRRWIEGFN